MKIEIKAVSLSHSQSVCEVKNVSVNQMGDPFTRYTGRPWSSCRFCSDHGNKVSRNLFADEESCLPFVKGAASVRCNRMRRA